MTQKQTLRILHIDSSSRTTGSNSRQLSQYFVDQLTGRHGNAIVTKRDVAGGLPLVDEAWVNANFTPEEDRSPAQRQTLALSDSLIQELFDADVVILGLPMYNFAIPAALKAWIDLVARARKTFHYTDNGPEGLVKGKKAYLIATTGGTPVGSDYDFATGYMKHLLAFIGIDDVTVIPADLMMIEQDQKITSARALIDDHALILRKAA